MCSRNKGEEQERIYASPLFSGEKSIAAKKVNIT